MHGSLIYPLMKAGTLTHAMDPSFLKVPNTVLYML